MEDQKRKTPQNAENPPLGTPAAARILQEYSCWLATCMYVCMCPPRSPDSCAFARQRTRRPPPRTQPPHLIDPHGQGPLQRSCGPFIVLLRQPNRRDAMSMRRRV